MSGGLIIDDDDVDKWYQEDIVLSEKIYRHILINIL